MDCSVNHRKGYNGSPESLRLSTRGEVLKLSLMKWSEDIPSNKWRRCLFLKWNQVQKGAVLGTPTYSTAQLFSQLCVKPGMLGKNQAHNYP
uniref:Uncharacterized protein n=1 Tax=Anguilla anguilla TaxID=7936 RepID=A0A0E9VUZ6_ANGAN